MCRKEGRWRCIGGQRLRLCRDLTPQQDASEGKMTKAGGGCRSVKCVQTLSTDPGRPARDKAKYDIGVADVSLLMI